MIVMKFGASSVGDLDGVTNAIDIVAERRHLNPIVVISGLRGVTGALFSAADAAREGDWPRVNDIIDRVRVRFEDLAMMRLRTPVFVYFETFIKRLDRELEEILPILRGITLLREVTARALDKIMSTGVKLTSVLFAYSMMVRSLPGEHIESDEVVWTNDQFGGAEPRMDLTAEAARRTLLPIIKRKHIPVMGGFIGRTVDGATTTLGRNGSVFSAAILGAAVGAEEVQIWTDVDGLFTCDPRLVPGARVIETLSFAEASELVQFGAKLRPRALEPAVVANVPVRILNTHNPSSPGTLITPIGALAFTGARSITCTKNITLVHVASNEVFGRTFLLERLSGICADLRISVDLIATSEGSATMALDEANDTEELVQRLRSIAYTVEFIDNQCIVTVVGQNLMADARVGARVLESLPGMAVKMVSLGQSGLSLSVVVDNMNADAAVRGIHRALFEEEREH